MNPFHDYISRQVAEKLKSRTLVVWYDARSEFAPFIADVCGAEAGENGLMPVMVGGIAAKLLEYGGSFFSIRAQSEPHVAVDQPEPLLIYIPGVERDEKGSILKELELAGTSYEPQLKRLARNVLRERYTDGVIDEMLRPEKLTYADIVALLDQGSVDQAASLLKVIFDSARENHDLIAAWLASPEKDQKIRDKEATGELFKLIDNRLGLKVESGGALESVRVRTARYVLVNEFRDDLSTEPPSSLQIVPLPETPDQLALVRQVAQAFRSKDVEPYMAVADEIEKEFSLAKLAIAPENLGSVDTFRFEEKVLLSRARSLIARGQYNAARTIIADRERGFWVHRNVDRQLQWTACLVMAELGQNVTEIGAQLAKTPADPTAWVAAYASHNGWYRADSAQRNLEALMVGIDEEPESEPALQRVRQAYEELLQKMAVGFTQALHGAGWSVQKALSQTRIFPELVEKSGSRVAYFLVDALRFEMGVELKRLLAGSEDLALRPAITSLPSITPIGMAALLPRAAARFDVVDANGSLAARIEGTPLKDLAARMKFLKSRVPGAVDIELGKLLQLTPTKLKTTIGDANLVVIRSQEIDQFGEMDGDFIARQMMDTVLQNVARGVRKLGGAGIDFVVITADHGYQFTREKNEAFRTDNPGGETVGLHRRCWIGRGGSNPQGTIRVPGAELGYDSDLDFIFPTGIGVFRAGGNLAYHHGGISLQEMVIPVITLRVSAPRKTESPEGDWNLKGVPKVLNNRTFGMTIEHTGLFAREPVTVRPVLLAGGEQVGEAGMAVDAQFDRESKTVIIDPGRPAGVAMLLRREDCASIRIAVLDPATDAVLVQSDEISIRLGV